MKDQTQEFDFGKTGGDRGVQGTPLLDFKSTRRRTFAFNHAASQFFFSLKVGDTFTPDDLVKYAGLPDEGPNNNNSVGAWINGMNKAGFIAKTGQTIKSERPTRRGGTQREWYKVRG